ncbi:uncharacterized protein TNCV_4009691 [Trichonephila clavipes]|nr:uncharacterized protein TNCV_4009691 [Trichonephila clavipes]
MIASFINDNHETWDQFLSEFAYALQTAVNEITEKTPAELFLGRKLATPFQKLVMVSKGTEFVVDDIEKLFEEATINTKVKRSCANESRERRGVQGKKTSLTGDQGGRRKSDNYKRRSVRSKESSIQMDKRTKFRHEVTGCKRKPLCLDPGDHNESGTRVQKDWCIR